MPSKERSTGLYCKSSKFKSSPFDNSKYIEIRVKRSPDLTQMSRPHARESQEFDLKHESYSSLKYIAAAVNKGSASMNSFRVEYECLWHDILACEQRDKV